jgi:hypothetical protein
MDWAFDNLTPAEEESLKHLAKNKRLMNLIRPIGYSMLGFCSIILPRLKEEPPPKTESYTPPKEDVPPSPYIPLAHR